MERARALCDDGGTMSTTLPPAPMRKATRDTQDTLIGGVASGLARHLGLPVLWVRLAFVVGIAFGGAGIAFYAGLWLVLPTDERFSDEAPGLASATRPGTRPGRVRRLTDAGPVIALAAVGLGMVFLVEVLFGHGALFWPIVLGVGGIALLWRQADEAQRERWLDAGGRIDPIRAVFGGGGWAAYARVAAGLALLVTAILVFSVRSGDLNVARDVVIAALLGTLGLAIVIGPWMLRLASDLGDERAERVRSQERADVAAHLHDSVLQTLALIQKNSADASTVARLARAQERDLRTWLFSGDSPGGTLSAALREIAAETEAAHDVAVEVVTVGDLELAERLVPVVQAAREAVTNAAKHAGVPQIDVYAEVSPSALEVFVKDRGTGFDPAAIAPDRQGVRGSIVDRMERHGGSAEIKSTIGVGTEVVLRMPLEESR
jgi:signal transduction histidine kinase/phage shock protein PspC (stress-responsive transcriptional regulator)